MRSNMGSVMRLARRHVTEVAVLSCLAMSISAPAIALAMAPSIVGGDTLAIEGFVHVDAVHHGLSVVATSTGTGIAWHNADHTADATTSGQTYATALQTMAAMGIDYLRFP